VSKKKYNKCAGALNISFNQFGSDKKLRSCCRVQGVCNTKYKIQTAEQLCEKA